MGRWQMAGDSLGAGIRYSGFTSIECVYDPYYTNRWYNLFCFEDNCDCLSVQSSVVTCEDCIIFSCNAIECG